MGPLPKEERKKATSAGAEGKRGVRTVGGEQTKGIFTKNSGPLASKLWARGGTHIESSRNKGSRSSLRKMGKERKEGRQQKRWGDAKTGGGGEVYTAGT